MILDTCAVLWLATESKKLSRAAQKAIAEAPAIYVSVISGFEIATKVGRGKLMLPHPPQEWFGKFVEHHGITVLSIDLDICIIAGQLPNIHQDPCDRFLIATAKLYDLPVVTSDEQFEKYGISVIC